MLIKYTLLNHKENHKYIIKERQPTTLKSLEFNIEDEPRLIKAC